MGKNTRRLAAVLAAVFLGITLAACGGGGTPGTGGVGNGGFDADSGVAGEPDGGDDIVDNDKMDGSIEEAEDSRLWPYVAAASAAGRMYLEVQIDEKEGTDVARIAREGELLFLEMRYADGQSWLTTVRKDGWYWMLLEGQWTDEAQPGGRLLTRIERMLALLPTQDSLPALWTKTTYDLQERGTYYAEVQLRPGQKAAYCFEGQTLKYIVHTQDGLAVDSVYQPTQPALTTTFPAEVSALLQSFAASQTTP